MSGYPHGLAPCGNEIKPVTHTVDWRKDGVATVRWCGVKYLFNAGLVLEAGETKPCPVCGIELQHDGKKKGIVEFPKLSPTETGGQMNVREALIAHEKKVVDMVLSCQDGPMEVNSTSRNVLDSRDAILRSLESTEDAPPSTNPGEPTDEMVRAALTIETDEGGPISQDVGFGMMRLMLEAALAVHQKGEG